MSVKEKTSGASTRESLVKTAASKAFSTVVGKAFSAVAEADAKAEARRLAKEEARKLARAEAAAAAEPTRAAELAREANLAKDRVVLMVDAPADVVLRRVAERLVIGSFGERWGTGGGRFQVVYQDRRRITASRWTLSFGLYILLMFFLFVPALIYRMIAQSKTRLTTVEVSHHDTETRVLISGNDPRANQAIARFLEKEFQASIA